ncbi:helix-turn-helix domain-containing protein [Sphingomonas sp. DT-51]|uniref:AlbA family DNA-binding domain-containing protein n=1 Tax=Sphingomonas sp. DT-51 TaxID=3396165 RepID=UPI003F1B561C
MQELVSQEVQESITLDYKRSAALSKDNGARNELVKDVSAFANSAGGMIIYEIEEEGILPKKVDGGVDEAITREWIEQVLNSRIQPKVSGLLVKAIPLASGGNAFVIEIPQATSYAPHQAGDRKYYKRFNFASEPMEDYEVKDALRRASRSDLYLRVMSFPSALWPGRLRVAVYIANRSDEPALYTGVTLNIDQRLASENEPFT